MDGLFAVYFNLGLDHILDIKGYDHMLFLLAICIPFTIKDWKKVLILATAFTIGHSITLALSTFEIVQVSKIWIEFLIPLTIVITAIFDLIKKQDLKRNVHYFLALFFGLIHGMGFSNFLKSTIFPGEESRLVWQLLYFNIGIEVGQIFIVIIFLLILLAFAQIFRNQNKTKWYYYINILSIIVIIWALLMCVDRFPY